MEYPIIIEYTKYLKTSYAFELIELYKKALLEHAKTNTGRTAYKELVYFLREMSKLDQGLVATQKLKSELLAQYKNRPAMKDELNAF